MDTDVIYTLPRDFLEKNLQNMNVTERDNGKSYWHIVLNGDEGVSELNFLKIGTKVDLTPYQFS